MTNTINKMSNIEEQYLELLAGVLYSGKQKEDRTGHGTISRFGAMIEHDMSLGFPLLTTKRMYFNMVRTELMWILNGRTDMQYLWDRNVRYWDHDYERSCRTDGSLGPVYGKQWRAFDGVDQIQNLLQQLMIDDSSRRMIVNAWNPADLKDMVLPPCHYGFQVYVNDGKLDLMWQQRSVDMFLGLPYDIAMYGLLLVLLADFAGYKPGRLIGQLGDCHIYNNHIDAVKTQLERKPTQLPDITFETGIEMVGYIGGEQFYGEIFFPEPEQINVLNYIPQPAIKAEFPNELN